MNQNPNNISGNILIADDEPTFLAATAQLLRNEGFHCDTAKNAAQAFEKLSQKNYDLLITDIKMPGNVNLKLVKKLAVDSPATSIILVTGSPSQQTAVASVQLPVCAYMVKPLDFSLLLQNVKSAVKISMLYKTVSKAKTNLTNWLQELDNIALALQRGRNDVFDAALKSFLSITAAKIDETFDNIRIVAALIDDIKPQTQICQVMNCPKLTDLTDGIQQAIDSIEKSRELFKSKQLAEIRIKLEKLLENIQEV
jgi:DNA-binding response OmpR family regulator